jgi:type VI secretion system secreted protein VgrG
MEYHSAVADETGFFQLQAEMLPADTLTERFRAEERISHPYEVIVDFSTDDRNFDVASCLRKQMTLIVVDASGGKRIFDGVVDEAAFVDIVAERLTFRVRLRPALASLALRSSSRIFQEKTIVQVIQTLFEEAGFGDNVEWLTNKTYEPREYIVQYRESDLNFVHRLMEEYGIFYFFSHAADGHKMFVSDDPTLFGSQDDTPIAHFSMTQGVGVSSDPLQHFRRTRALRATVVQLRDYDFEKPQVPPEGTQPAADAIPASYFEYPGGFTTSSVGAQLAAARMKELRADSDVVEGRSIAIGLRCGVPFTVEGAAEDDLNGSFVCTELTTTGAQNVDDARVSCDNVFRGIVKDSPWAPARQARIPRIHGVQTAIVTGSSEQEQSIYTDEHGRIKVRFYWDREGQQDHTSSCWIRVSQVGMGGSMILPRVGWEVSVAFLDGDPDRPLVLGRVYNGEKVPPQGLPAAKTAGSLKSWSSPGGGGYNEISFGDSGGGQGFNVHAQKDFNVIVKNNKTEKVGVDESHKVSVNESMSVGADETIEVGGTQTVNVGANQTQNVGGSQGITVGGDDTSNATANFVEKIDGSRSYTVSGNQIKIQNGVRFQMDGDYKLDVGSLQLNGSIASIQENVSGSYTHSAGAVTIHLVNGSHGETIAGSKTLTSTAAELHYSKANIEQGCDAAVTNLVGGLHYQKLGGDLVIKAPMVTLLGAVGVFKGGGSELKLGGGPVVGKGSKISVKGAMIIKMGGQLKMA